MPLVIAKQSMRKGATRLVQDAIGQIADNRIEETPLVVAANLGSIENSDDVENPPRARSIRSGRGVMFR